MMQQKRFSPFLLVLLPALILAIYYQSIHFDFLSNYDDDVLIFNNIYVKNLSWDGIKAMFSNYIEGLYHPLTTLSWAVDWEIANGDSTFFHWTNIIFHTFNSFLVFIFIRKLTKNKNMAFITAILFAISPMSVENVAWLSSRKDLCYAFFFLFSLIFYISKNNNSQNKNLNYSLSLVFFALALFSKAAAVVLPLVLMLIDYYQNKKWTFQIIVEKVPYFALSILFGILNIKAQQSIDFIKSMESYSIVERISMISYSILFYPIKSLIPLSQSAKYFYPTSGSLDGIYYLAPILIIAFIVLIIKYYKRHHLFIFIVVFYLINILLIVKIIPTGNDLVNERYAYIANISLFLAVAMLFNYLYTKKKSANYQLLISLFFIILVSFYSIKAHQRVGIWEDSISLWTDVIEKNPQTALAYNERGQAFFNQKKMDEAFDDLNKALQLNPNLRLAYINRASIYMSRNEFEKALSDYNQAEKIESGDYLLYSNRGNAYSNLANDSLALKDYNKSIALNSEFDETYNNKAILLAKNQQLEDAIINFSKAIEINPYYESAYLNRSRAYILLKDYKNALADLDKIQQLNPVDEKQYLIYKGRFLKEAGALDLALNHFNSILSNDPNFLEAIYYRADVYTAKKDFEKAVNDYQIVIEKMPKNSAALNNIANVYYLMKEKEMACNSWSKAANLGSKAAAAAMKDKCN